MCQWFADMECSVKSKLKISTGKIKSDHCVTKFHKFPTEIKIAYLQTAEPVMQELKIIECYSTKHLVAKKVY
jgi:hypothetical protein